MNSADYLADNPYARFGDLAVNATVDSRKTFIRKTYAHLTAAIYGLVLIEFFKAYNFRSDRHSMFEHPFANKWLNLAIFWELILLLLVVYLPVLHKPFGTFALTPADWGTILITALSIFPVLELAKWLERRGLFGAME